MINVENQVNNEEQQPMFRRAHLVVTIVIVVLGLALLPANAATGSSATFSLDCAGFTGGGGSILLNRDNTGADRESFIVSATDGVGKIIYDPAVDQFFVGATISWSDASKVAWTSSPTYNPLTIRVVSRAGNGFPEQLVTLASGSCEGLPTYGALPQGLGVYTVDGDLLYGLNGDILPLGSTSPDVPLNGTAPRPTNPADLVKQLPGYLLVNTDNLSVRTGDGPQYTLVAIVDGGTHLIPLGRNLDFSWWYVQADNVVGWVKASFLIARGDLTGVHVVPSNGEVAQVKFFNYSDTQLKSSPSAGSLELCGIAGNLDYLTVGRTSELQVVRNSGYL